ncbi:hypothetical protein SCUP515_10891 [Seiridium cupressi]
MSTSLPDGPVVGAATASRVSCGSSTAMKPVDFQALAISAVLRYRRCVNLNVERGWHRTVPSGLAAQSTTSHSLSAHPNPKSGNEERRVIAKKPKTLHRHAVACASKLKNAHPRVDLGSPSYSETAWLRTPRCTNGVDSRRLRVPV